MRILNLYAGIGGNRKLWTPNGNEHEITAVEYKPEIVRIYQDFFPKDKMVIGDAHQYLLEHYAEFDFIWSSPPCPSHSKIRKVFKQNKPIFPDMKLYEEILFLQGYFRGGYCVENVIGWYEPLIKPQEVAQHYFWANFYIPTFKIKNRGMVGGKKKGWPPGEVDRLRKKSGFNLSKYSEVDEVRILRNCVEPETGKYILDRAIKQEYQTLL